MDKASSVPKMDKTDSKVDNGKVKRKEEML